jgi:hypothetical protein
VTARVNPEVDDEGSAERVAELVRVLVPCMSGSMHSGRLLRPRYTHMGAILADTALQAGLSYSTVVQPRIERLLRTFPAAVSITGLCKDLSETSASVFLNWTHPEKVERFVNLVEACSSASVDTIWDFQEWVVTRIAAAALGSIRGIGPKSVDYLRMLAGHSAVPMDRHLFRFIAMAGVRTNNYYVAQRAFIDGCVLAGLDPDYAERELWRLMRDLRLS